jgi:hypothetical protein
MGAVESGFLLTQGDPDQGRAPSGVLPPQGQRGGAGPVRIGMRQAPGRMIVGSHAVGSSVAKSLSQMAYGAGGQAEGGGEAGGRLAVLSALEQLAAYGDGHRLRHGWVLRPEGGRRERISH